MTEITQADYDVTEYITKQRARDGDYQVVARHRIAGEQAGAEKERAKIVAWLRERDGFNDCYSELKDQWLSDRIARGEHLK